MKEDVSVVKLRDRLVGKTVTSVEQSMLSESYYYIKTSDGESFHICGTELGSWIVDGPRHDGTYPSLDALVWAVTDHRYEKQMFDEDVEAVLVDGFMVVDAGDGETFQIRPSKVEDLWERSVLSHPKAVYFLRVVLKSGEFWSGHFIRERAKDMEEQVVPDELLLSQAELQAKR
jgi:hypothetical protein